VVSIVAFGDIQAEDTLHLTETNFVKIFRLSQLVIEYLLYVQDCLQSTNSWLLTDR
jgi:zinc finger protein DZIP1